LLWLDSDFATDDTRKEADQISLPPPRRPPILQRFRPGTYWSVLARLIAKRDAVKANA
jgi:hypothetical protein